MFSMVSKKSGLPPSCFDPSTHYAALHFITHQSTSPSFLNRYNSSFFVTSDRHTCNHEERARATTFGEGIMAEQTLHSLKSNVSKIGQRLGENLAGEWLCLLELNALHRGWRKGRTGRLVFGWESWGAMPLALGWQLRFNNTSTEVLLDIPSFWIGGA